MKELRRPPESPEAERLPDEAWPDLKITVPPSPPRIPPGLYQARSVGLATFWAFRRRVLVIHFDVFDRPPTDGGVILARLPCYFRLPPPGRPLSPTSKLARVFDFFGSRRRRLDRLPLDQLRHRLWSVEVVDVVSTGEPRPEGGQRPLHERQRYSEVKEVVGLLA